MIVNERNNRAERILHAAMQMLTAARTAPKGRGADTLEVALLTGDDLERLAAEMDRLVAEEGKAPFFSRDAGCLRKSEAVILIGSRNIPLGLNCTRCGFPSCGNKPKEVPCVFNNVDAGIAIGSVTAMAAQMHIDNRVMFSAGVAAESLSLMPEVRGICAIPLSCSSKSPFFDR
ncbi:MAG: ferredoxin [Barnesiella sp.]|nr:ferredoxin [Barnesiella sp.]MDE6081788.1 ferredoxin [Muribaculaceae bacterium]